MRRGNPVAPLIFRKVELMEMDKQNFHNLLRILLNLDHHMVEEVISIEEWPQFRENPWRWFIRAEDHKAAFVWSKMILPKSER
jgi:hypothetical protein|tara:strand:- start:1548 stop:1796 length:249 start_codon:yes stop_codon:yes gene_type:complete